MTGPRVKVDKWCEWCGDDMAPSRRSRTCGKKDCRERLKWDDATREGRVFPCSVCGVAMIQSDTTAKTFCGEACERVDEERRRARASHRARLLREDGFTPEEIARLLKMTRPTVLALLVEADEKRDAA